MDQVAGLTEQTTLVPSGSNVRRGWFFGKTAPTCRSRRIAAALPWPGRSALRCCTRLLPGRSQVPGPTHAGARDPALSARPVAGSPGRDGAGDCVRGPPSGVALLRSLRVCQPPVGSTAPALLPDRGPCGDFVARCGATRFARYPTQYMHAVELLQVVELFLGRGIFRRDSVLGGGNGHRANAGREQAGNGSNVGHTMVRKAPAPVVSQETTSVKASTAESRTSRRRRQFAPMFAIVGAAPRRRSTAPQRW